MNRLITERIKINDNLSKMVGKVLTSNLFPTLKGRLLYIENGKCYFEVIKNPEYEKYNECEGQIEYLPERIVESSKFDSYR